MTMRMRSDRGLISHRAITDNTSTVNLLQQISKDMDGRRYIETTGRRSSRVSHTSHTSSTSGGGYGQRKISNAPSNDFLLSKEWIQMQKSTFTNWANSKLRGTDFQVEEIETDLADGVVLIKLLEVLSHGKRIGRYNEAPNTEARMRDNIDLALKFMEDEEKIQLVNIGSSDIHQGNLKLILGVLWSLVNRYQISDGKKQGNARKLLLAWVNACLPENNIKNFTSDWNDGRNLAALVDYCKPGLFPDHASLDPYYRSRNIARAMEIAENELNVPQVLLPDDLAVDNPDELSVMTYISGFCGPDSAGQNSLLEWINKRIPNSPATNFTTDWCDGHRLGALTDSVSGGRFTLANKMSNYDSIEICETAMDAAQYFLGVEKTISPEDFIRDDLSQLSRVTYLTRFQHAESIAPTNASKCIVSNLPEGRLRVSRTYSIKVDTSSTNDEEKLIASAHGPVKSCVIDEIGDDTYAIKFTPSGAGIVHIEANHGNLAIPGSPFEFTVNDPRKVKVNRAGIENGSYEVKHPIDFRLSTQHAGDGYISGIVRGPSGEEEIEIKAQGGKNYLAHFVPTQAGRHTITLKFDGDDIASAPIRVNVKVESTTPAATPVKKQAVKPDTADSPVTGDQRKHVYDEIGEPGPISLYVNADYTGEGKLEATCSGKVVGSIVTEVTEEEPKKYSVTFFPPKPDVYTVDVRMNIEYSPTDPFEPETCDIVGIIAEQDEEEEEVDGAERNAPKIIPFEQPAEFHVSVGETGCGTLDITTRGPGKTDMQAFDNRDGTYTCELKPFVAGKYEVEVLFEEQDPSASKFIIISSKKWHNTSSAFDLGKDSFDVGTTKHFKLDCEELGSGILEIHSKPRTASVIRVTPVPKTNTYQCEIKPVEAGDHKISIKYNGKHILGSPFGVRYESRKQKRSTKQSNSVSKSTNGETKPEVESCFFLPVDGTSTTTMSLMEPQPIAVTTREDNPESSDEEKVYYLLTTSKPQRIQGSPFELVFGPPETDASKCNATGDGLNKCTVEQTATFVVDTSDAGAGQLSVTIEGDGAAIEAKISTLSDTQKEVQYTPTKPGNYTISVFWDGVSIPNSPFTVTSTAPATEQSNVETLQSEGISEPTATTGEVAVSEQPGDEDEHTPEGTTGEQLATVEEESNAGTTSEVEQNEESQQGIEVEVEVSMEAGHEEPSTVNVSYTSESQLVVDNTDESALSDYFGSYFSKPSDSPGESDRY